ncbi:hypothetical protein CASFOL_027621 [Castilleja foliolosa]|uniref:KIB1-4 beta-propeller domain-containing protein n=1 Tax=Castilleja foliolosa TaxID=1961234 RepID=A0ABD3CFC0_9LAMI
MGFSSSSVLLRSICRKGVVGSSSSNYHILGKWWWSRSGASWFNHRGVGTATATTASEAQYSSPWLMLSPELEGGTMSTKFYSLAADSIVRTPSSPSDVIRNRILACRGSSHGWLALVSPQDDDFFLYNPISGRHINLPSIFNLSKFPPRLSDDEDDPIHRRNVKKFILSCSPDEENCRAVVINFRGGLAVCCPGRSKEWTLMFDERRVRSVYEDIVYSDKLKLFFLLTNSSGIETWDLGDLSSPKFVKVDAVDWDEYYFISPIRRALSLMFLSGIGSVCYLVVAKEEDNLLLVVRHMIDFVGPDGQCFDILDERRPDYVRGDDVAFYDKLDKCPVRCNYMTIGFDIWKHDPKNGKFNYLDSSSLGGLAIFVGKHSHSVAIPATEFPELKPNSIYFTDGYNTGELDGRLTGRSFTIGRGGHDIGIFNYKNRTVSPCYYPCDAPSLKPILPGPIWFYPTPTN